MKRYWLAFAMVLAPCLSLGGWAGWEYVSRWREDEGAMRMSWWTIAREAAAAALRERLDRLRAVAAAFPSGGDPGVLAAYHADDAAEVVFAVDGDGVRPIFPGESDDDTMPHDPRLEEARRAEFADGDAVAAKRAYRLILASAPGPAVGREAEAGLVAALAAHGEGSAASAELVGAMGRPGAIGSAQAAALALSLADSTASRREIAGMLLLAYQRILASPKDAALQERVATALAARADGLSSAERKQWRALLRLVAADENAHAEMLVFTPADRDWLAARAAGDAAAPAFRRLSDGMIAHAAILADGATVVALLSEQRITSEIADALRADPPLVALADAYGRRYGKSISAGRGAIAVDAPWGGDLRVDSPSGLREGSALLVYLPALAFLACALALAVAGFVFLYHTARRDLRLAQLKSDFVSNVSHEMKTPLSLVRMFGEMLSLGYERDEQERRRFHQLIVQESQRLGMLVSNVLDFAAIEKGRRRFTMVELDLAAVAGEVVETYREQLAAEGFALALDLPRPGPMVEADRDALKQVALNLLSNAMKYSREDRRVAVSVRREGGEAVLAVADHGIGIESAEHQRIFEQFYRVESGLTRETRGAGLGLSLVRSIVEAHGGRVTVDSALGRGSVFSVRLPLVGAAAA